jgi:hypothetical protein
MYASKEAITGEKLLPLLYSRSEVYLAEVLQLLINCHGDLNAPTDSLFSPLLPPVAAGVFFIQAQALREEEARATAAVAAAEVSCVV